MKKSIILFVILGLLLFPSCNSSKPTYESFSLSIKEPKTTIYVGENVTFTAILENNSQYGYVLKHAIPLITLYIYPEGSVPQEAVGSTEVQSNLGANEYITKSINIQPTEAGVYYLRAFCSFAIDGNDYYIDKDAIKITVIDK